MQMMMMQQCWPSQKRRRRAKSTTPSSAHQLLLLLQLEDALLDRAADDEARHAHRLELAEAVDAVLRLPVVGVVVVCVCVLWCGGVVV